MIKNVSEAGGRLKSIYLFITMVYMITVTLVRLLRKLFSQKKEEYFTGFNLELPIKVILNFGNVSYIGRATQFKNVSNNYRL